MKYYLYIKNKLNRRAILEGMAEESAELSQAALKLIRAEYGDNPTPVEPEEAVKNLVEELNDLTMYVSLWIKAEEPTEIDNPKWKRWAERLGYGKE